MRYKCPSCGVHIEISDEQTGQLVICTHCQARLKPPTTITAPAPPQIVVVQKNRPPRTLEDQQEGRVARLEKREGQRALLHEDLADRREHREQRHERHLMTREEWEMQKEDRKDRKDRNTAGVIGFALGLTTLLGMTGCTIISKTAPVLFWMGVMVAFPAAGAGLIVSLVGCFQKTTEKRPAVYGAIFCGVLITLVIPLAILIANALADHPSNRW